MSKAFQLDHPIGGGSAADAVLNVTKANADIDIRNFILRANYTIIGAPVKAGIT